MAIEIVNSREARARWRELLDKVFTGAADVLIERNGKPVAVLIPAADYEELIEELDELRAGRQAAAAYAEWQRAPEFARPWEEVRQGLVESGLLDG